MNAIISIAVGAVLGTADSSLALRPFTGSFLTLSARRIAWRFVARLALLAVVLAASIAAGADGLAMMLALLAGFAVQTVRILRRLLT